MTTTIPAAQLRRFVDEAFRACGVAAADAAVATDVVCYADEHGFTTHGTSALAGIYVPRLRDGRTVATARARVVTDLGAVAVLDGQRALGHVTMAAAVARAAAKARAFGIGMVAVRHSTHFGSAGWYALRLAEQNLVGLVMTNCGAQGVAPPLGGTVRLLGTNPIAAAVPSPGRDPFVLDMSTTVVASGKVGAARAAGTDVPAGWLHDGHGGVVTDPERFATGSAELGWLGGALRTGGAKGFGLGMLVDILCGPLAGAAFGPNAAALDGRAPSDSDIGHVAIAIDPTAFSNVFPLGIDELLDTVTACPSAEPGARVTYPGQPDAAIARRSRTTGVELPDHVADALRGVGAELGIELPAALTTAVAA